MTDSEGIAALATYYRLMSMNGGARVYRAALEAGVFASLAAGADTAESVAAACGLDERAVALLLDALAAIGAAVEVDGRYRLAPVMRLLDGPYARLGDEYWDHLPELLRTGRPMARMDRVEESEARYAAQARALAWMMRPAAEAAAARLGVGRSRRNLRILDVGAGSAIWSLTFAARDPGARVTAADWPTVLAIAGQFARQLGLADRFETLPGNFHETAFPRGAFDLAIVANVTHLESSDGNRRLFAAIAGALRPGGEIVVVDIMPGQPEGDANRALYALGLALRTEGGRVHAPEALMDMLRSAGFTELVSQALPVPPHAMGMILGRTAGAAAGGDELGRNG